MMNLLRTVRKMKWANRPTSNKYYYPRPTPMNVLPEEQEYTFINSYNGKCIYEWNLDGFTNNIYNIFS